MTIISYICNIKALFVLTLGIFLHKEVQSQIALPVNYEFQQFFEVYNYMNPSVVDSSKIFSIRLHNRTSFGLFEGVQRNILVANKIFFKNNRRFATLGIAATRASDGPFIQRNGLYISGAWFTKLSSRWAISAGMKVGSLNYVFKPSQYSVGGSDWAWDGAIGLSLYSPKVIVGLSIQQILPSTLRPLDYIVFLNPYWNIFYKGILYQKGVWLGEMNALMSWSTQTSVTLSFAPLVTWNHLVKSGLIYQYAKGLSIFIGIQSTLGQHLRWSIGASFLLYSTSSTRFTDGVLEFSGLIHP